MQAGSPYLGLVPYSRSESEFFFGRDQERRGIADNLIASRLTIVYGASGVGKSSVLAAGVENDFFQAATSDLRRGRPPKCVPVLVKMSAAEPLNAIGSHVAGALEAITQGAPSAPWTKLAHTYVEKVRSGAPKLPLLATLKGISSDLNVLLLIILDQFEDLFFALGREDVAKAAKALAASITEPRLGCNFIFSIREDAFAKLDVFSSAIPGVFQNLYPIRHLSTNQAKHAIRGPLKRYNEKYGTEISIDKRLVARVIKGIAGAQAVSPSSGAASKLSSSAGDEPRVQAPLLQLIMMRLWRELSDGQGVLGLKILDRLKGIDQILETHVGETLHSLSPAERDILTVVFSYLVTPTGRRVPHRVSDLARYAHINASELQRWLEQLAAAPARLLTPLPAAAGEDPDERYYEISHDVLAPFIKNWSDKRILQEAKKKLAEQKLAHEQAFSRELAAAALTNLTIDPERSLLLALEATRVTQTAPAESADALFRALQASRVRVLLSGHAARLWAAVYDSSGRYIATASEDGTARLWESDSSTEMRSFTGHQGWVYSVAFTPGAERLLTVGEDGTARLWDARTSKSLRTWALSDRPIYALAMAPSGEYFAAAGADGLVRIQPLSGGATITLPESHTGRVNSLAFSPGGECLASGAEDEIIRLWRGIQFANGAFTADKVDDLTGHSDWVRAVAFSPDQKIASASNDGTVKIWDSSSGKLISTLTSFGWQLGVAFNPTGRLLASSGTNNNAAIWDVETGQIRARLIGHTAGVRSVAFDPSGARVVTASADRTARVWQVALDLRVIARTHGHHVTGAAFHPQGKTIATSGKDDTARIWSVASGEALATIRSHTGDVSALAYSPDGSMLVTVSWDYTARFWKVPSYGAIAELKSAQHLLAAAFRPDGQELAIAGTDRCAELYRLRREGRGRLHVEIRRRLPVHNEWVNGVAYSPDGRLLATSSDDKRLNVCVADSGERILSLLGADEFQGVAFAPSRRSLLLLGASHDGALYIWSMPSGQLVRRLGGHSRLLHGVAVTADGQLAVTSGGDGTANVWELASGKLISVLEGHVGEVIYAAFNPAGDKVATCGMDRTARIWDPRTGQELAMLNRPPEYTRPYRTEGHGHLYGLELSVLQRTAEERRTRDFSEYERKRFLHEE